MSFRIEFWLRTLLSKVSDGLVPLRKPCEIETFPNVRMFTSEFVPVTKLLVWGRVVCPQLKMPCTVGSRFGVVGPSCEITPFTPDAPLPMELACVLLPSARLLTPWPAPDGPCCTFEGTPRSNPPAWARLRSCCAIEGP